MPSRPRLYLRSYPIPNGMQEHAASVEEDGWDGLLFTDTQNLSMEVFGSLYLAASATSHGLEHATQSDVIPADFLRRFCVIGPSEECIARLCELLDLGLSHLVIVGGSRDIDTTVREYSDHLVGKEVLPALRTIA